MLRYRTPLNDFVLDQIDFVECKLNEAVRDAASQISAITEASGVVPQLRERMLSEDQDTTVQSAQACPELFDRGALAWWNRLAIMERTQFLSEASGEQGKLAIVKNYLVHRNRSRSSRSRFIPGWLILHRHGDAAVGAGAGSRRPTGDDRW
jgi:hypothetical protein